jgi:hypothetical protein
MFTSGEVEVVHVKDRLLVVVVVEEEDMLEHLLQ